MYLISFIAHNGVHLLCKILSLKVIFLLRPETRGIEIQLLSTLFAVYFISTNNYKEAKAREIL